MVMKSSKDDAYSVGGGLSLSDAKDAGQDVTVPDGPGIEDGKIELSFGFGHS